MTETKCNNILLYRKEIAKIATLRYEQLRFFSEKMGGKYSPKHKRQMIDYANGLEVMSDDGEAPFFMDCREYSTVKKMVKVGDMLAPEPILTPPINGTPFYWVDAINIYTLEPIILNDIWGADIKQIDGKPILSARGRSEALLAGMLFYSESECQSHFYARLNYSLQQEKTGLPPLNGECK